MSRRKFARIEPKDEAVVHRRTVNEPKDVIPSFTMLRHSRLLLVDEVAHGRTVNEPNEAPCRAQ